MTIHFRKITVRKNTPPASHSPPAKWQGGVSFCPGPRNALRLWLSWSTPLWHHVQLP